MKFERIAYTAIAALIATACSGGDDVPSAENTAVPEETTTLVVAPEPNEDQIVVEESTTTVAVTTTTESAPESLAFSSSRDVGRLYEIDGAVESVSSPGQGEPSASLADGTLVRAARGLSVSGELWVGLVNEAGDAIGWVRADDLRPTSRTIASFEPDDVGQFRQVRGSVPGDQLVVLSEPESGSEVGQLLEREIAMHGGNSVLASTGDTWIDVIDAESQVRIGWVVESSIPPVSGSQVRTSDNDEVSRRPNTEITYGASLPAGRVLAVGCNATQIAFTNSSGSLGLSLLFGLDAPVGRESSNGTVWSARGGATMFVDPGETAVFTFLTDSTKTWYFTALDESDQAATTGAVNDSGELTASNVQEFTLAGDSCRFIPEPAGVPDTVPPADTASGTDGVGDLQDELIEDLENAPTVEDGSSTAEESPTTTQPADASDDSTATSGG